LAIADLNAQGVGLGGVTFNVAAGYTEAVTSQLTITATGIAGNEIVFQKDISTVGANPKITRTDAGSNTTTVLGGLGDAIVRLDGTDYITIDGIDVQATTSTIEYGYLTYKPTVTNGCQYVTIKNCNVTMTKGTSGYVMGIYVSNGTTSTSSATGLIVTANSGRNENITINKNYISNVHVGVYVRGYSSSAYYDQNIVVGANDNGNTINNYGGGSATSTYGVYLIYVNNASVAYNVIDNAGNGGTAHASTLYGIFYSVVLGNIVGSNNNITLSNSSTAARQWISNANAATSIDFSNNTFASGAAFASTSTSYIIYNSSVCANVTVNGNVTSGTINKTSASGTLYAYYNAGGPTNGTEVISNNNFSNITVAGTSAFTGIHSATSATHTKNIFNNTISNITLATGSFYGINASYGLLANIYNNNINTVTSTGTIYGIQSGGTSSVTYNTYSNTISGLTTTTTVYGINASTATTNNIYKNNIYNLTGSAAGSLVYGLNSLSGTTITFHNNFVSDLKAPNATGLNAVIGLNISGGTTVNAYFNTIYLNAISSSVTTFGTAGIYKSSATMGDLRNNIVVNNSTPGLTGLSYNVAFKMSGTYNATYYASNSNNNCFYAGTPSATNLIFFDGTNSDQTLTDFRNRVSPRDVVSVSEMPPFINSTSSPYNLHLTVGAPSQCESAASAISSITIDFDGDTRNASTPDIGADEGSFGLLDLTAPSISYTTLANTSLTTDRILTATITDASGIPTSGPEVPRLYWSINNTGAFSFVEGLSIGSNQYTFTFGGGVSTGDSISYYVVAQDIASTPNIAVYPSVGASGLTAFPPAVSIPPTNASYYKILGSISGIKLIGPSISADYPDITSAIAALNSNYVVGPLTFNIEPGTYIGQYVIQNFLGVSSSNPLEFKSLNNDSSTVILQYDALAAADNYILKFSGANYVTFKGVTFQALDLTYAKNIAFEGTCSFISLLNNEFNGTQTNRTTDEQTLLTAINLKNTDILINRNYFKYGYNGINIAGLTETNLNTGIIINFNNFYDQSLKSANLARIDALEFSYNNITSSATNTTSTGVSLNQVKNQWKFNNNVIALNGGPRLFELWYCNGTPGNEALFYNNMLSMGGTNAGHVFDFANGTSIKFYHNTFHRYGAQATATGEVIFLNAYTDIPGRRTDSLYFYNNIFANSSTNGYLVKFGSGAGMGTYFKFENNNYFTNATTTFCYKGAEQTTLTAWKALGYEVFGRNSNPQFVSNNNLHINSGLLSSSIESTGDATLGILTDIDGDVRPGPFGSVNGGAFAPDMGADEFDGVPLTPMTYTSSTVTQTNTSLAMANSTNNQIIGIEIVTNGVLTPLTVTEFALNTLTTLPVDISNAKIFATGNSAVFAATTQFGSTVASPTGVFTITGSRALEQGTNYFWLTYDIPSTATSGNTVDASCSSIKINAVDYTPTTTDPLGSRPILGSLSGTYTVGTGGDFDKLSSVFSAVNTVGLSGNVTFNIISNITETSMSTLNQWTENPVNSYYTITIKPSGGAYSISGSVGTALIKLNGADRVTINGLNTNGDSLSFINNSTAASTAVIWLASLSATNGANNNTIKNLTIKGGSTTAASHFGVYAAGTSVSTAIAGSNNDTVTIENNKISNVYQGIYVYGGATPNQNDNLLIKNNSISAFAMNGIYCFNAISPVIEGNVINTTIVNTLGKQGIYASNCPLDLRILKNKIYVTGSTGSMHGVVYENSTSTATNMGYVYNNFVSIQNATSFAYGLRINNVQYSILSNNSIYVTGSNTTDTRGINTTSQSSNIQVFNNCVLSNKFPVFYEGSSATASDYNNYYSTGSGNQYAYYTTSTLSFPTLAALIASPGYGGKDAHSISIDPVYYSTTDLHTDNIGLFGMGTPISFVTDDIDGDVRNLVSPTIGAVEITPLTDDAGIIEITGINAPCPNSNVNIDVKLKNFGLNTLTSATINWQLNGVLQTPYQFTGSLATVSTTILTIGQISILPSVIYSIKVWTSSPNGLADQNNLNDTLSLNNIIASIAGGTYTIGATNADYPSITAAVNDLNTKGICSAVIFDIQPDTYTGQYTINNIAGSSATNTITFESMNNDSVNVILQYDAVNATDNFVFKCNGTNYISFKGLTIKALDATYANVFTLSGTMNNLNIQGCIMEGTQTINTDDNQVIIRCSTLNQLIGFNLIGNRFNNGRMALNFASTIASTNVIMKYNIMYNQLGKPVNLSKIDALDFGYNQLFSDATRTANGGIFTTTLTGQMKFYNNSIINLGGLRVWEGWTYGGTAGQEALVYNNYFYGSPTSSYVLDIGGSVSYVKFYNNTLVGNSTNTVVSFNNWYGCNNYITFKNNILYGNAKLLHATPIAAGGPGCTTNFTNYTFDYNDYYTTGATLATFNGTTCANLAALQTASGQESHSISINPQFAGTTDPHITNAALIGTGISVPEVVTDVDGEVRNTPPTIGADELISDRTLNLTLLLEGLYNGTTMNPAQDMDGNHWGATIADIITVELRDDVDPTLVVASFTNKTLSTTGICTLAVPYSLGDLYYITVKHRNSIQTWSALPISFNQLTINYNFTTAATQAFGDNQKQIATGVYALFVGDVNQDEVIDLSDLVAMDTDLTNGTVDYVVYDLNGDGVVDLSDLVAIDVNLTNGVVSMYP
jgi:hypothetical protein